MKKVEWLNRRIAPPGPYLCLCLSPEQYLAAVRHCKLPLELAGPWLSSPSADATTHLLENEEGKRVAIISMRIHPDNDLAECLGLLIHEAVHVWQYWKDDYGEQHPGREQEAYAIQGIAQELIQSFMKQIARLGGGS